MAFAAGDRTNSLVPLFATGPGSELFAQYATQTDSGRGAYINNTDVFRVMNAVPEPSTVVMLLIAAVATSAVWRRQHSRQ
jgi:hypothetical protein